MQKQMTKEQATGQGVQMIPLSAGIILLLVTFGVPMDIIGMYHMFSVHMVQHLLLSLAIPPLLILSIPKWYLSHFFQEHQRFARVFRGLTYPLVSGLVFNATIWFWHAPPLLSAMMSNTGLHILANLLYLVTGLLFWWPLVNPIPEQMHGLSLGAKLAYLFFSDMPMMLLGAGMTFSTPLYSFDMSNPTMHMLVTTQDQQVGGLFMWVVGSIFFIVIASILFLRWMLHQEKEQQAHEAALDAEAEDAEEADAPRYEYVPSDQAVSE